MIVLGIDPGINGAIARLTHDHLAWVVDMPVRPKEGGGKIRNEIDPRALQATLRKLVPADEKGIVLMESQHAFMGGGEKRMGSMASQASLAATKAVVSAVCELTGLDVYYVTPQRWQAFYGIRKTESEDTKKQSLRIARQTFGNELCPLSKHDGRADALLIAHYGQRTMT